MKDKKILIVVTGTSRFAGGYPGTGLWLSEFTHIYNKAKTRGFKITAASPKGGPTPIDPVSLKPMFLDKLSKSYWRSPEFRVMLQCTPSLDEVAGEQYDCIYLAGGHGAMYDFPNNAALQEIIRRHYEDNLLVTAICHGVCGLVNVRLSNGEYLVKGKKLTGFSWFEEILAARARVAPFNLEAALKRRGAEYHKAIIPLTPEVIVDGNLITGQDPFSVKETATTVMKCLCTTR